MQNKKKIILDVEYLLEGNVTLIFYSGANVARQIRPPIQKSLGADVKHLCFIQVKDNVST